MGAGRNLCVSLCYRLEMAFSFATYISLYHNLSTVTCLLFNGDFHILLSTWLAIWNLINSFPLLCDKGIQIIPAIKFCILEKRMQTEQLSYDMHHFQLNCSLSAHGDTYPPRHPAGVSVKLSCTSEGTELWI